MVAKAILSILLCLLTLALGQYINICFINCNYSSSPLLFNSQRFLRRRGTPQSEYLGVVVSVTN